jgi:F-type H+-transporting ATPase subunit b
MMPTPSRRRAAWRLLAVAFLSLVPAILAAQAEAGHAEHPPEKGEVQYISQAVWAIASFLVFLAILLKKVLPPIVKSMDKRARDIQAALNVAEQVRAEAKEMIARHEESLEKARKEAASIIEEGKSDALRIKESIIQSARKDAEEIAGRARREIEQAKTAAVDELDRRSVQLAVDIASKLMQKTLDAGQHQDLIQERIRVLKDA